MALLAEIDRILGRLDKYRCRRCDQICLTPHTTECPKSHNGYRFFER